MECPTYGYLFYGVTGRVIRSGRTNVYSNNNCFIGGH